MFRKTLLSKNRVSSKEYLYWSASNLQKCLRSVLMTRSVLKCAGRQRKLQDCTQTCCHLMNGGGGKAGVITVRLDA